MARVLAVESAWGRFGNCSGQGWTCRPGLRASFLNPAPEVWGATRSGGIWARWTGDPIAGRKRVEREGECCCFCLVACEGHQRPGTELPCPSGQQQVLVRIHSCGQGLPLSGRHGKDQAKPAEVSLCLEGTGEPLGFFNHRGTG